MNVSLRCGQSGRPATSRRLFLKGSIVLATSASAWANPGETGPEQGKNTPERDSLPLERRVRGLLIGGMIGDALGGPVEFGDQSSTIAVLPKTRDWPSSKRLDAGSKEELRETLKLLSYEKLRPGSAPYGPWRKLAPAGTVTDDTRHKMVLVRAIKAARAQDNWPIGPKDLARQYIDFQPHADRKPTGELALLCTDGMLQYRYAAEWLLGERRADKARPLERLWAGIDNCSGQMLLPPIAVPFSGNPDAAYRAAYALDFVDTPGARDIAAAINAGLAQAIGDTTEDTIEKQWQAVITKIRHTDPFGYSDVPFAGRPLHKWLDLSEAMIEKADGSPKMLFQLLETDGKPVYWWDAHFTFLCAITILRFCDYDVLAALHLALDFGHDTDSYAQVIGCLGGAVCGEQVFPQSMREQVMIRLQADYGENLDDWYHVLDECHQRVKRGQAVVRNHGRIE